MKVIYSPLAKSDILEAVRYIAGRLHNPSAAEELLKELDRVVQQIAQFPYSCELYRSEKVLNAEIRKAPIKNYVMYYVVRQDCIEIWRFLHGRRDRDQLLSDED
jgi:plasmid stabilization system protein ParE